MNENNYYEREKKILEKISEIYIFIIIIVFPLCVDSTGFFKILECKYRTFLSFSVIYLMLNILIILYYYIFHKTRYLINIKLKKYHWAVIGFLLINVLSCFISPYFEKYNLFVGVGRGEGLITISLYCLTFLAVSLFGNFEKRYITYFSISSICLNTVAILQYVGFNPFNMYQDGIGTHNVSFMTTIGNIDFISAIYCILLTISFVAFVFLDENIKNKLIHLLSVFMGFFIFIIINVMSGRVAFLLTFVILFPFIITNSKWLYRTIIAGSTIIFGLAIDIIINPQYHYSIEKLTLDFQFNEIALALLIITVVFGALAYYLYKNAYDVSKNKKLIKLIYISIILCVILAFAVLYFVNFQSGILYEVHELLHGNFDDDFGTYRVFLWKRAFTLLDEHALIGSGPDTFAVRFMDRYTQDVAALGELSINDTAGNVYITMLINIGIIGLISYLIFLFFQFIDGIKSSNKYSIILLIAILCYCIQDLFNLWVVIVTPVFWILMAVHILAIDKSKNKYINNMEEKNNGKEK